MTYRVTGSWQESCDEEYDNLADAHERATELDEAHPGFGFRIEAPGFQAYISGAHLKVEA